MPNKYLVEYSLAYDHVVRVGISATDKDQAIEKAEQAFEKGEIWENTAEMPLLYDDFEESEGNTLSFSAKEIESFPDPARNIVLRSQENADLVGAARVRTENAALKSHVHALSAMLAKVEVNNFYSAENIAKAHSTLMRSDQTNIFDPIVVQIGVEGGLITGVTSNYPVNVVVFDYDIQDDGENVPQQAGLPDTKASVDCYGADVNPEFISRVDAFVNLLAAEA
jgi:hypothetical protein